MNGLILDVNGTTSTAAGAGCEGGSSGGDAGRDGMYKLCDTGNFGNTAAPAGAVLAGWGAGVTVGWPAGSNRSGILVRFDGVDTVGSDATSTGVDERNDE